MKRISSLFIASGLLVLGMASCPAQAAVTNTYELDTITIWDISGNYSNDTLSVDYTLSQDGKGKITGFGSAVYSNVDLYAEMDFNIKGHVKTHNKTTTLHFVMKTRGKVDYEGMTYPFKVTGGYKADVDPKKQQLSGSIKAMVQIGDQTAALNETFREDLPAGMDGSADLTVVCDETAKGVAGTAVLTLSNGTQLHYSLKGKLNIQKGEGRFKLKGLNEAKGSNIQIDTDLDYNLLRLKGRVLGQKIEI
jgi:hypothetical protein